MYFGGVVKIAGLSYCGELLEDLTFVPSSVSSRTCRHYIHAVSQNCQPQSQADTYVSVPNIQQTIRPQFPTKETKDVAVPNILNNVKVSVPDIYANKQNMERFRLRNGRKGPAVIQLYYAETYETPRPDNKSFISFK